MERQTVVIILAIANIPVYFLFGWGLFGSWAGLWECIRFWLTPDIVSLFRGEYGEDRWSEMKLGFFVLGCGVIVFLEYLALDKWLPQLFKVAS